MSYWRRRCCSECGTVLDDGKSKLIRGPLMMDRALRYVTWRGAPVHFTPAEFDFLELLAQREGKVVQTWSFFAAGLIDEEVDDKIVDVYACKVRAKFAAVDPEFSNLHTVWGEGYLWKKLGAVEAEALSFDDALRERVARSASA